jgi:PDZ domain-containing secreted protein
MVDDTRARPPSPRRRRRWPFVVGGAAVLVVVLLIVGFTVTLPYYTLSPGSATPVSSLITLPPGKGHPVRGSLFLTDVELQQLRLIDVIPDSFDSNVSVVSAQDLLGGTPADQYEAQSLLQMTDSKDYAEVAALRRLGYQVPEEDEGAVVVQAQPGSPASGSLHVADVIVAVDGVATPNEAALVKAIRSKQPGEVVHLVVQPGGRGLPREVPVKLGVHSVGGREVPFVGVVLETRTVFKLPFNVQVLRRAWPSAWGSSTASPRATSPGAGRWPLLERSTPRVTSGTSGGWRRRRSPCAKPGRRSSWSRPRRRAWPSSARART